MQLCAHSRKLQSQCLSSISFLQDFLSSIYHPHEHHMKSRSVANHQGYPREGEWWPHSSAGYMQLGNCFQEQQRLQKSNASLTGCGGQGKVRSGTVLYHIHKGGWKESANQKQHTNPHLTRVCKPFKQACERQTKMLWWATLLQLLSLHAKNQRYPCIYPHG